LANKKAGKGPAKNVRLTPIFIGAQPFGAAEEIPCLRDAVRQGTPATFPDNLFCKLKAGL